MLLIAGDFTFWSLFENVLFDLVFFGTILFVIVTSIVRAKTKIKWLKDLLLLIQILVIFFAIIALIAIGIVVFFEAHPIKFM